MDTTLKTAIWRQFGAAIDYFADTVNACPDPLWLAPLWQTPSTKPEFSQFWYVTYHTLFWLDLYLTGAEEGFLPPAPFTLIEQYEDGPLPERVYTKAELLAYLDTCRQKCKATIAALTDVAAYRQCRFAWGECSFFELLIYNLRHVHGHASQMNMLLGQHGIATPDYQTQIERHAVLNDSLTRDYLMREMESSWSQLHSYLASLTNAQLTRPTDAAGWTAKDHVIHLAMWEQAGIALLEGKSKREAMAIPAEIWAQGDDPINAVIQQRYHNMPWDEVMQTFHDIHGRMLKKLASMTEADLQLPYRHYQPHSTHHRPIIWSVFGDTIVHYREHLPWIAAIVQKA